MSHWEESGKSNEWYTPEYVFNAMDINFDMDVAAPKDRTFIHTPTTEFITERSLEFEWNGVVWMNPPFGGRNSITPWIKKLAKHGHGIGLTPDRTSTDWWQMAAKSADAILFVKGKIKFIRPDGTTGDSPSTGTTLFAYGHIACQGLQNAERNGLGITINKPQ